MRQTTRRTMRLPETLTLLGVLICLYVLRQEILSLKDSLTGGRRNVAHAAARRAPEPDRSSDALEQVVLDCTDEWNRARNDFETTVERLRRENDALKRFLLQQTREFQGSVLGRIAFDREELATTREAVAAERASIRKLTATLQRDPEAMKRKMVFPTVQLRGNGTVGSGVIVYSQAQPGGRKGKTASAATFVLTAYHVVAEVLGEKLDEGVLQQIHVLLEDEPDTTKVYHGKLVLFDRDLDVALVRLNTERRFRYVATLLPRPALQKIDVFTPAYAVGCPLGNLPLPTLGEVSSKSKRVGAQVFWMLNAPTFFGNSGGGVYLASKCELIGISSMIYTYGKSRPTVVPHMGLFVPLGRIYRWLDSEGYSFVHKGEPIPEQMLWKLVYRQSMDPEPKKASGTAGAAPSASGGH